MGGYNFGSTVPTWNGIPMIGMPKPGFIPGLWGSKVLYVDGTYGSDGNNGLSPKRAVQTIQKAVNLAGRDSTIYIRPKTIGYRYQENVTVPVTTHPGLSIIGTGNGRGTSVYQACNWRCETSSAVATLLLHSPYANVENMNFFPMATQLVCGIISINWNTGGGLNMGSSIINCGFWGNPDSLPAAGVLQSTIRLDSTGGILIEGNIFKNCRIAISCHSTMSAGDSINIIGNQFTGTAANIAADIYITDYTQMNISQNMMGHDVPAQAAGPLQKYIYCSGTVAGNVTGNVQGAADVIAATNNTLSNLICSGNFGLAGPWTS